MNQETLCEGEPAYREAYVSFLPEDFDASIRILERLGRSSPRNAAYANDLAVCLYLAGARERARELLRRAAAAHGRHSVPRINQAYLFDPKRFPEPADRLDGHEYLLPAGQPDFSGVLVSIVILEYHNPGLSLQCLRSIPAALGDLPHEVILIDNSETPAEPEYLQASGVPRLRYRKSGTNLGFAGGCNLGASLARGSHLYFLNNDTLLRGGCVEELVRVLLLDPKAGITGSKLLYEDGSIQHAGVIVDAFTRRPKHRGRLHPADDPFLDRPVRLQAVTAASLMIGRELFERLGGFSEDYRNGFEDVDLCLKARTAGYEVVYNPRSVLVHFESKSKGRFLREQENLRIFEARWREQLVPDELDLLSRGETFLLGFTERAAKRRRRKQLCALVDTLDRRHPRVLERLPLYRLEWAKRLRIQKACTFLFDEWARQGETEGAEILYRYLRARHWHHRKSLRHMRSVLSPE